MGVGVDLGRRVFGLGIAGSGGNRPGSGRKRRSVSVSVIAALISVASVLPPAIARPGQGGNSGQAAGEDSAGKSGHVPGPPESDRHPPPPAKADPPRGKPAPALSDAPGQDASVEGLQEATELRGESARFFEHVEDEPHVAQLYTSPISFRENGEWKEIDNTLVPVEGGYVNAANAFEAFFPSELSATRPVTLTYPQGSFSFEVVGARPARATAEAQTVTYADVRPHMDLAFDMTTGGIKERALLRSRAAQRHVDYHIVTDGLSLEEIDGNRIAVVSGESLVAYVPAPFAYDSSIDPATGEPATTYDVDMQLRQQGPNAYGLTLEIAPEWFEDPERVFPVTLDPSVQTRCQGYYPNPCPTDTGIPL